MTNEERANAIMKGRRANHPHPSDPGMRIVGWVVPEDVAGMSDALFALEEIERLSLQPST